MRCSPHRIGAIALPEGGASPVITPPPADTSFVGGTPGMSRNHRTTFPAAVAFPPVIFAALVANQLWTHLVRPATGAEWRLEHGIYLAVAIGCSGGWLALCKIHSRFADS